MCIAIFRGFDGALSCSPLSVRMRLEAGSNGDGGELASQDMRNCRKSAHSLARHQVNDTADWRPTER